MIHTDIKLDNILIEKNILNIKNDDDVNIKIQILEHLILPVINLT